MGTFTTIVSPANPNFFPTFVVVYLQVDVRLPVSRRASICKWKHVCLQVDAGNTRKNY